MWKRLLPVIALGLLLAAWGMICLGRYRADHLDLSRFGPCEDVLEALARDSYILQFQFPYLTAAVLLDGLAVAALFTAFVTEQSRVIGVLVAVLCVPTVAWHGLMWYTLVFSFPSGTG